MTIADAIMTLEEVELPDVVWEECPECQGLGFEGIWDDEEQDWHWQTDRFCPFCDGAGEVPVPAVPIDMEDTVRG